MTTVVTEQPMDVEAVASACSVPEGTAHALEPGADHTRCGIDCAWLTHWPEVLWPPSALGAPHTCPVCEAAGGRF